jgi:APA family basic amino acid/polyamine antiporter
VPGGPFIIPGIGAVLSVGLIASATIPTIERLFIWMAVGFVFYFIYGYRHSYLNHPERRPADMIGRGSDPFAEINDEKDVIDHQTEQGMMREH